MGWVRSLVHQLTLSPGTSLAVVFLVAAVVVGYWSSRSLQDLQELRSDIDHRMESVAQQEQELRVGLEQQHKLFEKIATDPDVTVKRLSASIPTVPRPGDDPPSGVIVISAKENKATIAAMHLPQLPPSQVYHVWLIKHGGLEIRTATLTVDSTARVMPKSPLTRPWKNFEPFSSRSMMRMRILVASVTAPCAEICSAPKPVVEYADRVYPYALACGRLFAVGANASSEPLCL